MLDKRVRSPSGKVHDVDYELDGEKRTFITVCHSSSGPSYFIDMIKNWPVTTEETTCKTCIRIRSHYARRNNR